jgi:hypothetical protein
MILNFRMILWSPSENFSFLMFSYNFFIETSNYIFLLFYVQRFSEKNTILLPLLPGLRFFYRDLQSTEDRLSRYLLYWYGTGIIPYIMIIIFVGKCAVSNNTFPCHAVSVNRHFLCLQVSQNGLEIIGLMIDRLASDFRQDTVCFIYFFFYFFWTFPVFT